MRAFKVTKARQKSLIKQLSDNKSLISELSKLEVNRSSHLRSSIDLSAQQFPLLRSHVYVGTLENVNLVKRKYFVTENNEFLAEGLTHSDYSITWEGLDDSGLREGRRLVDSNDQISLESCASYEFDSPCIFIGGDTIVEPNFAHWFFEHLLKLRALQIAGVDMSMPILVSSRIPTRFREWADLLCERQLNWESRDLKDATHISKVWVSSCPAYRQRGTMSPTIWDQGFEYLNDFFRSKILQDQLWPRPSNVVFCSRSSAKWRRARNESELGAIASEKLGAKVVSLETLSPLEQVNIAKSAEIMILFGGADGPIVNFCRSSCRVIEIVAPGHAALYTAAIFCAIRGIRYSRLIADHSIGPVLGPHPLDRDYWIDPKRFLQVIDRLSKG
jgi:hypothetical protein